MTDTGRDPSSKSRAEAANFVSLRRFELQALVHWDGDPCERLEIGEHKYGKDDALPSL